MTPVRLAALVDDLTDMQEVDLRALLAASAHELARRRGVIRLRMDLHDLARHIAQGGPHDVG